MRLLITSFMLALIGCATSPTLNQIPMYGNVSKSPDLLEADSVFIKAVTKNISRDSASIEFAGKGFHFLDKGDPSTAIKRFNQSWLLDTTNYLAYWGFAAYYRTIKKPEDSVFIYLQKAYSINENDCLLSFQTLYSIYKLKMQNKMYDQSFLTYILQKIPGLKCPNSEIDYTTAVCEFGLQGLFQVECK